MHTTRYRQFAAAIHQSKAGNTLLQRELVRKMIYMRTEKLVYRQNGF